MFYTLFLISLILNILFIYLYRNWGFKFEEKLKDNNFFEDDHVNVEMMRKGDQIYVSISSEQMNFKVNHHLKPEKLKQKQIKKMPGQVTTPEE